MRCKESMAILSEVDHAVYETVDAVRNSIAGGPRSRKIASCLSHPRSRSSVELSTTLHGAARTRARS
jgi:hypothetical protein